MADIKSKLTDRSLVTAANKLPQTGTQVRFYVYDGSEPDATKDRQIYKQDMLASLLQSGDELNNSVVSSLTTAQREGFRSFTVLPVEIWLPAIVWTASEEGRGAAPLVIIGSEDTPDIPVFDFLNADDQQSIQLAMVFPAYWNRGSITCRVYWTTVATTGDVRWAIRGCAASNSDILQPDFGSEVVITDSVTAGDEVQRSAESAAISIAGSPANGDVVYLQILRRSDHDDDTVEDVVRFLGARLIYTEE